LAIASTLEIPELLLATETGRCDVTIRIGSVPTKLESAATEGVFFEANDTQFLLSLEHIGWYLVQNGNEIIIQPASAASALEVRLFLLGSCFGALLHQRGLLAIHASAVEVNGRAVLFAGKSGSGKSTLLGKFLQRGYQMLADDIAAIGLDDDGEPLVLPAFPRSKLWSDAAEILGHDPNSMARIRPDLDKFALSMPEKMAARPVRPAILYLLTPINRDLLVIRPIKSIRKFNVLVRHTYRRQFLDGLGLRSQHFRIATTVAKQVNLRRIFRPRSPNRLDALVDMVESDILTTLSSENSSRKDAKSAKG
jgi:hypothetical protein